MFQDLILNVSGMSCAMCASLIEEKLSQKPGIKQVNVNVLNESAHIQYDSQLICPNEIVEATNATGFVAQQQQTDNTRTSPSKTTEFQEFVFCLWFFIPEFFICMVAPLIYPFRRLLQTSLVGRCTLKEAIELCLAIPVQMRIGKTLYAKSHLMVQQKCYSMDLLLFIATNVCFFFSLFMTLGSIVSLWEGENSFYETSITLLTFITLGKCIERKTRRQTNFALQRLSKSKPKKARLLECECEIYIQASKLSINDIVRVMPGESIPIDGIIIEGKSKLNESLLSGEPTPKDKKIGDLVLAGAINIHSPLIIKATTLPQNSFLEKLIFMVQSSQSLKSTTQLKANKISSFFIPTIIAVSLGTFLFWCIMFVLFPLQSLGFPQDSIPLLIAVKFSISVLVYACPCSLALAVPSANAVGIGIAAERGVLVKNANVFENAALINTVLFDKTGTLTSGKMTICKFKMITELSNDLITSLLGTLEEQSEHFVADIIKAHLKDNFNHSIPNCPPSPSPCNTLLTFAKEAGCGVIGTILRNHKVHELKVGRITWILSTSKDNRFFRENFVEIENCLESKKTVIGVSLDSVFCAYIVLADAVRKDSASCISSLKRMGMRTGIISGDALKTVKSVACSLGGLELKFSEISPLGKRSIIGSLQEEGCKVAMVGDGINDALALTQADLGIAVFNGTDLAVESADAILIQNDLGTIPLLLQLSRVVKQTIIANFCISFAYNICGLPLAAGILYQKWGIYLHPAVSGVTMALSSLCVVCCSLSIRRRMKQ